MQIMKSSVDKSLTPKRKVRVKIWSLSSNWKYEKWLSPSCQCPQANSFFRKSFNWNSQFQLKGETWKSCRNDSFKSGVTRDKVFSHDHKIKKKIALWERQIPIVLGPTVQEGGSIWVGWDVILGIKSRNLCLTRPALHLRATYQAWCGKKFWFGPYWEIFRVYSWLCVRGHLAGFNGTRDWCWLHTSQSPFSSVLSGPRFDYY